MLVKLVFSNLPPQKNNGACGQGLPGIVVYFSTPDGISFVLLQGGPPVISGVTSPTSRTTTPGKPIYFPPFTGGPSLHGLNNDPPFVGGPWPSWFWRSATRKSLQQSTRSFVEKRWCSERYTTKIKNQGSCCSHVRVQVGHTHEQRLDSPVIFFMGAYMISACINHLSCPPTATPLHVVNARHCVSTWTSQALFPNFGAGCPKNLQKASRNISVSVQKSLHLPHTWSCPEVHCVEPVNSVAGSFPPNKPLNLWPHLCRTAVYSHCMSQYG